MSGALSGAPTIADRSAWYAVPILNGGTITGAGIVTLPGTIAASGTFTSAVIPTFGMPHVAVSAQIDQIGSIVVQPYLDAAGTIPNGAPITKALTANTLAVLDNIGTVFAGSMTIAIVNSGTVAANVSPTKFYAAVANK